MQILYIVAAFLGLGCAFFGIRKIVVFYWTKPLLVGKLSDGTTNFTVEARDNYTIFVTGGMFVSDASGYSIEVFDQFGGRLDLSNSILKQRLFYKTMRLVELLNFTADQGTYRVVQTGSLNLRVKKHRHPVFRVFSSRLPQHQLGILIRRRVSPWTFGLSIALTVIGVQLLAWGIILASNPEIFK